MESEMTDKIVVFSTCGDAAEADRLARHLVEERLAACVSILPALHSVYRWKEAIEEATEVLLLIKTSRERFEAVRQEIEKLHSYEVPEIVAVPIVAGSPNYLNWLEREMHG